jgi:putative AdoMet-dependent methyltransferase
VRQGEEAPDRRSASRAEARDAGERLFDRWAARYDESVRSSVEFPFAGYEVTLDRVTVAASSERGHRVLDVGIGTGNLAKRFMDLGCEAWGIDVSAEMLAIARAKLPMAHLSHSDITADWPSDFPERFDRIVSAYVFHHFDLDAKVELLARLVRSHCSPGGLIVVGDIAFRTASELSRAQRTWGRLMDPDEDYWVADEAVAACELAGLGARYEQVSVFAGVFVVQEGAASPPGVMADGSLGFSYCASKGGAVSILRGGRVVTEPRHGMARQFLADVDGACAEEEQLLMARYTGNYKRGNEREARRHPRHSG